MTTESMELNFDELAGQVRDMKETCFHSTAEECPNAYFSALQSALEDSEEIVDIGDGIVKRSSVGVRRRLVYNG